MSIEAVHVSVGYGKKVVLRDLTLSLKEGEVLGLAGLNGSGKTTTIKTLAGIISPHAGKVLVDGVDPADAKEFVSEKIAWVQENPLFETESSIFNLVKYFATLRGIDRVDLERTAHYVLMRVGLSGAERMKVTRLSMGMRKRLSIAVAMLGNPKYYLFDEMFNGLDPEGIKFMKDKISELRSSGHGILLSSHVLSELQSIANRVVIIVNGETTEPVTLAELLSQGQSTIRLRVSNPDENLLERLKAYGPVTVGQDQITVSGVMQDPSSINAELVKAGYLVTEFVSTDNILEEYFAQKTGAHE